jgi:hypothetical protein
MPGGLSFLTGQGPQSVWETPPERYFLVIRARSARAAPRTLTGDPPHDHLAVLQTRRRFALVAMLLGLWLPMVPAVANAETVLVTGANSGIGLEFTRQYLAGGWTCSTASRRNLSNDTLRR